MAKFVKGDVVVIPFPFSDLSQSKRRPALVLTTLDGDDAILCQITSKNISDKYAVPVDDTDFRSGHLKQSSNIQQSRRAMGQDFFNENIRESAAGLEPKPAHRLAGCSPAGDRPAGSAGLFPDAPPSSPPG